MLLYKELIGRVGAVIQGAYQEGGCCYTRSLSGGWVLLYKELIRRVDAVIQGAYQEGGCCYTRSLSGGWVLLHKELIRRVDAVIQGAYQEGGCCYTRTLSTGWMLLYKELIMAEDSHQITMHNCEHWNSFKGTGQGNIGETPERRGGAHVSFSKHIYTTLNWTELNWTMEYMPTFWCCLAGDGVLRHNPNDWVSVFCELITFFLCIAFSFTKCLL